MYITMITFLCPFLLESPTMNLTLFGLGGGGGGGAFDAHTNFE